MKTNSSIFPERLHILNIEPINKNFNFIPEGIKLFIQEWKNITGFYAQIFKVTNELLLNNWVNELQDFSTILIPIYQNPTPIVNHIIKEIKRKKKNIQIFICGPLVHLQPLNVLKYIPEADGVLGNEPSLSLIEMQSNILTSTEFLPESFFKIINHKLPDIEDKWIKDGNTIRIFPQSFAKCSGRCSFCQIGQNQNLQKFNKHYTIDQL